MNPLSTIQEALSERGAGGRSTRRVETGTQDGYVYPGQTKGGKKDDTWHNLERWRKSIRIRTGQGKRSK